MDIKVRKATEKKSTEIRSSMALSGGISFNI